jgi:hypothetical protein
MNQVRYWGPTNIERHFTEFGRHCDMAFGIFISLLWESYLKADFPVNIFISSLICARFCSWPVRRKLTWHPDVVRSSFVSNLRFLLTVFVRLDRNSPSPFPERPVFIPRPVCIGVVAKKKMRMRYVLSECFCVCLSILFWQFSMFIHSCVY